MSPPLKSAAGNRGRANGTPGLIALAGVFILSFDFELAWGTRANATAANHAAGVEATREVVGALLHRLDHHGVSATWATVGHLMLDPVDNPRDWHYTPAPSPDWFRGDWFEGVPAGDDPAAGRYYAPELVQAIVDCPTHQELASHTFSHPVLAEVECPASIARAELEACRQAARRFGRELTSLVFPRNQIGHLNVVAGTGHNCFRGPFNEWYWRGDDGDALRGSRVGGIKRLTARLLRFADECLALTPKVGAARQVAGLCEIPHGMFFPGSVGLSRFVPARCKTAKAVRGLTAAAASDRVFSLFTHPHNFLPDIKANLTAFDRILGRAAAMRDEGKLVIQTRAEHASEVLGSDTTEVAAA
ncbi:MAG: hypothetical protein AAF589_03355 [Planctomycetota bacterium]